MRPSISPRRPGALAATVAIGASLLVPSAASAGLLSPEAGGSPNADRIQTLYWLIFAMALVVFAVVGGALVYAMWKFRATDDGRQARQIHGNTKFEIGCTVGAAAILVFLSVVTFVMLPGIKNPDATGENGLDLASGSNSGALYASTDQPDPPGGNALNIVVDGQQYAWRYQYPDADGRPGPIYSVYEMVVPTDTTVTLDITADDVNHSWWIPKLGGKFDAIPGYTNKTWFKAKEGVYEGQCAELCGRNHADMKARVRAVPPEEYERWLQEQAQRLEQSASERDAARPRYEGQ